MPKILSALDKLKQELSDAIKELSVAESKYLYWKSACESLTYLRNRLQSAVDAMEGRSTPVPITPSWEIKDIFPLRIEEPIQQKLTTLNGEPIILESGFKIVKNSFGEESIVPDGMPTDPMEEPVSPGKNVDFSLPALGDFPDPQSEFMEEINGR